VLALLLRAAKWFAYFLATYLFLILLFEHVPRTAHWAARMIRPLAGLSDRLVTGTIDLLPRLALALLIAAVAHVVLRALGRLFEQVRAGRARLEPFLSRETAGPAELTARAAVLASAVFLIALLVPGEAGVFALAALGLVGLALALGARDLAADFLAGLVIIYGRPVHRGERVRIGDREGTLAAKGLLHLTLRTSEGRPVVVPNRVALSQPFERLGEETTLHLRVVLEARDLESASGLCRHAAAQSGLRREDGRIVPRAIGEGRLELDVRWPLPDGKEEPAIRAAYLAALLDLAPGLGARVISALPAGDSGTGP
jgi:small-conductance mechanosensitive channel